MTVTKRNQPKSDVSARPTGKLGKNQSGQAKTKSKASKDKSIHLGMKSNYWYIHGVAYDFTKFIDNHPGGRWAINLGRGRECSGMLHSYHLNMPAESLLAKYRLPESEQLDEPFAPTQKFTFDENGFFKKTQRDAMAYFKEKNLSHKAPWSHFAFFVLNVVMMLVGLYYMVKNESYLAAAFHGIWRSVLVVQTTHAASHFSFSHNPTVNRWAYRLGTVLIGLWCPTIWDLQHVVAHHIYTNEWPYDTDSAFPLKSLFANQRRFGMHKLQHIYMWFVYALTIPLVMLNSIKDIILGRQVLFRIRYQHIADKIEAWGCSIGSVIYLLIPFYFLGFSKALPLALLSSVISSLYFSMQFVVNHEVEPVVHSSTESYLPPANPDGVDWGAWQLANSLTFNPHSWWALMFSGGLNTQVEHHLFPGVHFSHYRNLVPIIQRNAKKFGLKYHYCDDLTTAVKLHYRLLKNPPDSIRH